jgi:hypothetical protein
MQLTKSLCRKFKPPRFLHPMHDFLTFLADYPYFANALVMLALSLAGIAIFPAQRHAATLSGLLALPWGIWGITLVPDYWTPRLVLPFGNLGVEDFMWAFVTGVLAWLAAAVPARHHLALDDNLALVGRRYAIVSLVGAAVFLPLWLGGIGVMTAFLASNIALGLFLACIRPKLLRLAVGGALGFGLINALVMKATLAICPAYYDQMSQTTLSGAMIGGLLVKELDWAFAAGAVWPMVVCYVLEPTDLAAAPG